MKIPKTMPRLKGFRFPREIISYAVWAYHRFALSTADVEDCIKRDRPGAADKWHLDEVVILIGGKKQWLWRAVDANGDVLDILVQDKRDAYAAKKFLVQLVCRWGKPRVIVTDKPIGSKDPIAQPENERKLWVDLSRPGKPRGFSLPTIKSTQFSARAAIV